MPWERRRYRKNKVWIQVDDRGRPLLDERDLMPMRYKPEDERTYSVRQDEVRPLVDPGPAPKPAAGPSQEPEAIHVFAGAACPGGPGPAGLGVVLLWRGRRREIQRFLGAATETEAQLAAVLAALEAVRRPDLPVVLYTSDRSVVVALEALEAEPPVQTDAALLARIREQKARFASFRVEGERTAATQRESACAERLAAEAIRGQGA